MSREDRLALLNSEVFQELELAERVKQAQDLSDKIVNSPTAQKAISDGITKALENKDDDGEYDHEELKGNMKKLTDHELFEISKMFVAELKSRGISAKDFEDEYEEEEDEETEADEEKEDEDFKDIFSYVTASLNHLANSAADSGNTEAAYLIERFIQKIS